MKKYQKYPIIVKYKVPITVINSFRLMEINSYENLHLTIIEYHKLY